MLLFHSKVAMKQRQILDFLHIFGTTVEEVSFFLTFSTTFVTRVIKKEVLARKNQSF